MRQNKQGDLSFEGAPCLFCVIEQAGTEAQDAIGILLLRRSAQNQSPSSGKPMFAEAGNEIVSASPASVSLAGAGAQTFHK